VVDYLGSFLMAAATEKMKSLTDVRSRNAWGSFAETGEWHLLFDAATRYEPNKQATGSIAAIKHCSIVTGALLTPPSRSVKPRHDESRRR
jgi:hypothetical protein